MKDIGNVHGIKYINKETLKRKIQGLPKNREWVVILL